MHTPIQGRRIVRSSMCEETVVGFVEAMTYNAEL